MGRVIGLMFGVVATTLISISNGTIAHAAPSVTCPQNPARITDEAAERLWESASRTLTALDRDGETVTFPFGSTGKSSRPVRTNERAWTAGFYPASLWLTYAHEQADSRLTAARRYTDAALTAATWRGTHDLGFMVGLPDGLGVTLDTDAGRRTRYESGLDTAARSLASRWNSRIGALQSGSYDGQWGLIIDSAMNAPLLIERGEVIGGTEGRTLVKRGTHHLIRLAEDFIRPDGSTIHRQAYDPDTGDLIGPIYGQGRSTTSTWARGQAWAITGFAHAFAATDNDVFLDAAQRTADYWISQVPAGCIPAWDLTIERGSAPRDSSAAAITSYGMLRLAEVESDPTRATTYRDYALTTLGTLAQKPWTSADGRPTGILQRQAYNIPSDPREGTYAWGDTYLLLALASGG